MDFYKHVLENKNLIIEKTKEILRIPSVLTEFDPESETPFGVEINSFSSIEGFLSVEYLSFVWVIIIGKNS